jgi:hypothetical protein
MSFLKDNDFMKIKNIKQYRSFYKTEIRDLPTRDENFIGNFLIDQKTGKKKFGWFEVYHGDKDGYGKAEDGIENFLQSFLDMAKDGQAVYEFLQNAVDAGSTHYTMIWDQDPIDKNYYLLVANNGKMFDLNSIRSILNVGSSTKTADSKTIGKFGIGFKLAHRLVGKDNGLQELIHENSGPILFSWKNYELENLANNETVVPEEIEYKPIGNGSFEIVDNNPWLFKILITCFPCLPENDYVTELPKMANGVKALSNPFGKDEYDVLARWIKKNKCILKKETYKEGALFFIKLGSGKETELAEINLKEGVKFALAILKETADTEVQKEKILQTVQLNNEEAITYPDLEYIKLSVDKETEKDTYSYIRFGEKSFNELTLDQKKKISEEANIEALFGFRKHAEIGDYFKGAPNLYLYFPLSEEVHNFNYILHSNAFYKGSSRTFLHKGSTKEDGINERLLKTIVNKIDNELYRLSSSTILKDRELFLNFYAALLTSGKSLNQDRLWIEAPYINPLDELLKKYIPVRSTSTTDDFFIVNEPENVFIKKTQIDIDTKAWNLENIKWFYWGDEADINIRQSAFTKLGVKDFTVFNLLSINETISANLNVWINADEAKIKSILSEISPLEAELIKDVTFKKNLFSSKLLKFNNDELLTINEFQEKEKDGYFLIFNKLNDIKDLLQKLGVNYSKENFDDYNFQPKYFSFFANESQVRSYSILTKLFSQVVKDENLNTLNKAEKYRIFEAFRTLNDSPGDRMGELKLFKNNNNKHVCFKNLYASSNIMWLSRFCILNSEDNPDYKKYLLDKPEEVYQGIVYPFWEQIAEYLTVNQNQSKEILEGLIDIYEISNWAEKQKFLLHTTKKIIFQNEIIESDKIFYSSDLKMFPDQNFKRIQTTVLKYYGVHIPDKNLLPYLDKLPFYFTSVVIHPKLNDTTTTIDDINDLLQLSKECNIDFFASNCILLSNGVYSINSTSGKKQIVTEKLAIVNYITTYYPKEYVMIPNDLKMYKSKIELSENKLVEHIIVKFEESSDILQELDLVEVVLTERYDDKKNLLNKLTFTNLDADWIEERQNDLYIKLLNDVVEGSITTDELAAIHNKISINKGDQNINIGVINSANDSIEVYRNDKKITLSQSQILNLDDANSIKLIQTFNDEAKKRDLLNQTTANRLFKISKSGITDELVDKFIKELYENQLENSHQLLFVLLSGKFRKEELKSFSLKFQDNQWNKLEKQLIIYSVINEKYINNWYLINECYSDLQSLIQLNDTESFNYGENEEIITSSFLFVKGCNPDVLESAENINGKLNFLFKGWISLPSIQRISKRQQDWKKYLTISPNEFVMNGIQLESEELPKEFISWYNGDKLKDDFFMALGVNINNSPIDKIRKYLTFTNTDIPVDLEIDKFNVNLLLNTINGLSGKFNHLNNQPIIYNGNENQSQLLLIEKIINQIVTKKVEQYPVIIYIATNTFRVLESEVLSLYKIDEVLHEKLKGSSGNQLNILYEEYNILKQSNALNSTIIDGCDELEFDKTFIPSGFQLEHDEPFYHNWKKENSITLFRENDLKFDFSIDIKGEMTSIGIVSEEVFYVNNTDDSLEIYYCNCVSLEDLSIALSKNSQDLSDAINDLIRKRNIMLASIYNTLNSTGNGELQNSHLEALKFAIKEENLKQERKELIEDIKNSNDYSYDWFESYLKFLLTFESKQSNTSHKTITFQEIRHYIINDEISSRYFLLCGASSLIPMNIEDFDDFKITLEVRNRKNIKINVEGVSKKGQDLLIFCREAIPQSIFKDLSDIVQVKISFSPVLDLLEKLSNAFEKRANMDVWDDIMESLPNLHFIYGPPGTGKTTSLCSEILDGLKEKYDAKYLLLTPTNKAADVLCKKLLKPSHASTDIISNKLNELEKLGHSMSIARLGKPTDPELEELGEDIYQTSLNFQNLDYINVLASCIHRIPYFEVVNEENNINTKLFKLPDYWDYVIFDEASMINLPYIVFAIFAISKFSPNVKFIVAGDPKQIPPVVDVNDKDLEELDIQDENIYTMMGINSFEKSEQVLRDGDKINNLTTQFRSVKNIGQLFSDLSYKNLLTHDRAVNKKESKPLPEVFKKLINENVTFIDVPLSAENSIFRINKLLYSSYHTYSAIFVAELIKYFDSLLDNSETWSIGLIAPYKAQAILLNKLITSYGISDKLKIYSDTVHGFQGDECDIVFFISNPNNYYFTGHPKCLLSKEYIYNVAISRARDYLIILHPFEAINNNTYINSIMSSYGRNFGKPQIKKSSEIEKIIFNQKDFIEMNSYITGHDNVNVFGQIEMKYFIKASDNAIDIQLRK